MVFDNFVKKGEGEGRIERESLFRSFGPPPSPPRRPQKTRKENILPVSPELAFQDHQIMLGVGLWPGVDEVMYLDSVGVGEERKEKERQRA